MNFLETLTKSKIMNENLQRIVQGLIALMHILFDVSHYKWCTAKLEKRIKYNFP